MRKLAAWRVRGRSHPSLAPVGPAIRAFRPAEFANELRNGKNEIEKAHGMSRGRDFDLEPRSANKPDLVIRGWVEVDGKSVTNFKRIVNFTRQVLPDAKTLTASK